MEIKKNCLDTIMKVEKDYFLKNYLDNGWIVKKNFLKKKEVLIIKNKVTSFLKKNYKKYKGRDINFLSEKKSFTNINTFHKLHDFKYIKKLSKKKLINDMVCSLLNSKKIELRASELFAKPKNYGLKVPTHQDNFYWNVIGGKALTIWIALSHSSKKNGGIFYYNKSHKNGILPHKSSFAKGSSQTIKNKKYLKKFKKIYPDLEIGDAVVHSSLVIHGSHRNKSNMSRKGLTFQFKTKESKYNYPLIKKYENKLQHQIKLREK